MTRILSKIANAMGVGEKTNETDVTYIGQGFNKSVVEEARPVKEYEYFELITEGEHKGKYQAVLSFGSQSTYRNKKQEAEMFDLYKKGKEIYAPDPKADPRDYTVESLSKRAKLIFEQGRDNDFIYIDPHAENGIKK